MFLNIVRSDRGLPRFLIHDGVFHSIGARTIINTLNYIYSQSLIFPNLQYITTVNEGDFGLVDDFNAKLGELQFDFFETVIAKFEDIPEKMFFKQEF